MYHAPRILIVYEVFPSIIYILQVRKLRYREVNLLNQTYTTSVWQKLLLIHEPEIDIISNNFENE